MAKLERILNNYAKQANLLIEQDPAALPPVDPMAAPPADPMAAPGAAPVPPVAGAEGAQGEEEEGKTKTLTDQGYVMAVQDMLELLSINPEDLEEGDMGIFEDKVNPRNAYKLHDKLKSLIERYGSPTA